MGRLAPIRIALKIAWRHRRRPGEDTLVDVAFLGGLFMVAAGFGWIYAPLFLIVGGTALSAFAWMLGSRPKPPPPPREADRLEPEELD
jgi:hypothetical protein